MDQTAELKRVLTEAIQLLDTAASSITSSKIDNTYADIEELGKAIGSISEVLVSVYERRPDLAPDGYKKASSSATQSRTFSRVLLQNESLLAKNRPAEAIEGLRKFISTKPKSNYEEMARDEIQRIEKLFGSAAP